MLIAGSEICGAERDGAPVRGRIARVLVVDDALYMRALLRAILTEAGHVVVGEACTGRQAVVLCRLFHPDVVLMDLTMPEEDGFAAMGEILALGEGIRVIICTAMRFHRTLTEAIARGAWDFVTKPFKASVILAAVERAVQDR
ncbi:MAG: response regulator [Patescibacteria group bacterium]